MASPRRTDAGLLRLARDPPPPDHNGAVSGPLKPRPAGADGMHEHPMASAPDPSQHVRRVTLPSGRAIEVVYFESVRIAETADLHVCNACGGELVNPVRWQEAGLVHWEIELRCPDCGHHEIAVHDQAAVDRFDAHLDRGLELIARDLRRLERANMEEELVRLRRALAADALLPEDF